MTGPDRDEGGPEDGFDFTAPRWRELDGSDDIRSGKERRLGNESGPDQAGSIDAADSVPGRTDPHHPVAGSTG
jgi:hypothetical protein